MAVLLCRDTEERMKPMNSLRYEAGYFLAIALATVLYGDVSVEATGKCAKNAFDEYILLLFVY